ncbi:MAG: hypothetical protein PHE55_06995, partial [Methylococcaceae bacterium]|nr:hypothetical protein [Methylococcaceae bacterium]
MASRTRRHELEPVKLSTVQQGAIGGPAFDIDAGKPFIYGFGQNAKCSNDFEPRLEERPLLGLLRMGVHHSESWLDKRRNSKSPQASSKCHRLVTEGEDFMIRLIRSWQGSRFNS